MFKGQMPVTQLWYFWVCCANPQCSTAGCDHHRNTPHDCGGYCWLRHDCHWPQVAQHRVGRAPQQRGQEEVLQELVRTRGVDELSSCIPKQIVPSCTLKHMRDTGSLCLHFQRFKSTDCNVAPTGSRPRRRPSTGTQRSTQMAQRPSRRS